MRKQVNKKTPDAIEDITIVVERVRRSTRRGRKGLLLICTDDKSKEYRFWYRMR